MSEGGDAAVAAPQIQRADPALRRLMLALVALILAAVGLLGWWYHGYLDELPMDSAAQVRDSVARPLSTLSDVLIGMALLFLLYGVYLLQRQREVQAVAQYPQPHMRLFHDMRILEGEAKRRHARGLAQRAVLCLLLSAGLFGGDRYWLHQQAAAHPRLLAPADAPPPGSPLAR
jgi:hypothetical protein